MLKTMVCSGRPKPSNNEVRGRTDRQTVRRRCRQSRPVDQLSQEGGEARGDLFPSKHAPSTLRWGGTMYALQMRCSAISSHPMTTSLPMRPTTARSTHTSWVDQLAGTSLVRLSFVLAFVSP